MPVIYNTIAEKTIAQIEELCCEQLKEDYDEDLETEIKSLFRQFRLYQDNRLKINKESRESKMAARKEGGGGAKRGASAKMTGVVKLVAIEGQENTFKVEKVSIPVAPKIAEPEPEEEEEDNAPLAPAPKPKVKFVKKSAAEPEVNLAEDPEALAAAVAEAAAARAAHPSPAVMEARAQKEAWKKSEAERKKQEGIAKRKATMAAKKEALANAAKTALVAEMNEDSDGERTDTDNEDENDE